MKKCCRCCSKLWQWVSMEYCPDRTHRWYADTDRVLENNTRYTDLLAYESSSAWARRLVTSVDALGEMLQHARPAFKIKVASLDVSAEDRVFKTKFNVYDVPYWKSWLCMNDTRNRWESTSQFRRFCSSLYNLIIHIILLLIWILITFPQIPLHHFCFLTEVLVLGF